jgi:hypothetical protein
MKNIELKINELELNNDIWWLIRLQDSIARKISEWINVSWNIAIQVKIWKAIKRTRNQLDDILYNYSFDDGDL